jgi:hypothetical protein
VRLCQLRHVETKEVSQPAVVRQQPLREFGHSLPDASGAGNRYGAIKVSCFGSVLMMRSRWRRIEAWHGSGAGTIADAGWVLALVALEEYQVFG